MPKLGWFPASDIASLWFSSGHPLDLAASHVLQGLLTIWGNLATVFHCEASLSRAGRWVGFKRGGSFPIWTCPSFFSPFRDLSGIFPICPGIVRGFSRFVLFLCLGLTAPTRNSPERFSRTILTFLEKSGKPPRFSGESNRPLTPILLKEKYRGTPPISIAILLPKYALPLAESSIYTTNLYHETPPICIAILLQKY